jgi:multidrug efflux pump subunit AcrB
MQYMPITLIAVLGSSLVVALVFIPVLGSIFGRKKSNEDSEQIALSEAQSQEDLKSAKMEASLVAKCHIFACFSKIDFNLKKVRRKLELYKSNPEAYRDSRDQIRKYRDQKRAENGQILSAIEEKISKF